MNAQRTSTRSDLARYAANPAQSLGRQHPETPHPYRSEFQRDRDRVIHSTAFRRLVYKTQVFVNHEGDLYRTRLTHSLEVAQIARTLAVALGLNENLVEAICLAHDLGHTPFGHAGQDALNDCMREWGGFEHNLQSLRVVDELEEKYAGYAGLNLTFETREGILKHCSRRNARSLGDLGRRFLEKQQPGLEAQLANIADEIAYNNHDVDDGLRAGLLNIEELREVPIFASAYESVCKIHAKLGKRRLIHEIVRRMIDEVVTDLYSATRLRIDGAGIQSIQDVRQRRDKLVGMSVAMADAHRELKQYLAQGLYRHERVARMSRRARRMIKGLFECYMASPELMPEEHALRARALGADTGEAGQARAVADYVAGMTDRYAIAAYERLSGEAVSRDRGSA
jgi:dGTPase